MTDIQETAERFEEQPMGRCSYAPPALREFGPVGALTQSGTDPNTAENTMMNNQCNNNPNAGPCVMA